MGLFITVEGSDYTGKTSTVIPGLQIAIINKGLPVLVSREPGGTIQGEHIRQQIFEKKAAGASAFELAVLFNQARAIHLNEKIITFLGKKKEKRAIVILDRYLDSTRVYQGYEGGVAMKEIFALEKKHIHDYLPDLTLILYFPKEVFLSELKKRLSDDRQRNSWDKDSYKFQLKRQQYYLKLPKLAQIRKENRNFLLINAAQPKVKVVKDCINGCQPFIYQNFAVNI